MIDLFGIPNSLVLGRTIIYKSKFSGFVSLWVYIALMVMMIIEMNKMLYRYETIFDFFLEKTLRLNI